MDNAVYIPSTWRRLCAHGIDSILRAVMYVPFAKSFFLLMFTEEKVVLPLEGFLFLLLLPAIYEFLFLYTMQATPGKWLLGLKVVPQNHPQSELHWTQCVLRSVVERGTLFVSWALYATAFFKYDRTHVADWVAETRVVQFSPRQNRTRIRWVLGLIFIVLYSYDGLRNAQNVLRMVDWQERQLDLRVLLDGEAFSDIMIEFEEADE